LYCTFNPERTIATMINAIYHKTRIGIMIIFILSLFTCSGGRPEQFILSDFESDADLDKVQWQCHTLFSIADENATHGHSSLRLELYPSAYPGIAFELPLRDWRSYNMLSLDIYNPQGEEISLAVRIDDRKEFPQFDDRYTESFSLKPGMNHLRIPLDSLATTGTGRCINLKTIYRCLIFMAQPQKNNILFLDYVHLAA